MISKPAFPARLSGAMEGEPRRSRSSGALCIRPVAPQHSWRNWVRKSWARTSPNLPSRAGKLDDTRRALVADAVEDLAALMQPGLRALSALAEQGRDTTAAALQLWREYYNARSAIVALAFTH